MSLARYRQVIAVSSCPAALISPLPSLASLQGTTVKQTLRHHSTLHEQHVQRLRFGYRHRWSVNPYRNFQQKRYKSHSTDSSQHPLSGLWKPTHLQRLYYGPESVKKHLKECLPSEKSKAFIVTGTSLANKTGLIKQVEELLGSQHAGTFSKIGQHAPVKQLDEATELVLKDESIDTIISVGGGSPIDSAKAISHRLNERKKGKFLHHITTPTTLSAAECTLGAGYTNENGIKTGVAHPELAPHVILYDSKFALETPPWLWMSTALRAMDHAVELMYHPTSTEMPCRWMALYAAGELFRNLPKYKENPKDEQTITKLQLAAFASLGFLALNVKGGLGLSHTLGYALGSPYQIPHGITSCLTLGHVVKLKAESSDEDAAQLARMAPFMGISLSGDNKKDAVAVGDAILNLVKDMGLKTTLTEKGVGKDQVPVITKTATRQESGPLYERVKQLVEDLY
jgi:alcohol dehydrogenase class IV